LPESTDEILSKEHSDWAQAEQSLVCTLYSFQRTVECYNSFDT